MPVTADDLKFFASAVMTDTNDGGGARASTVLQSGATGAIFPAVSASARATGQVRIRKMYAGPVNADADALLGATLVINEVPTDPAVSVAMFRFGDSRTTRAQALAAFTDWHQGIVSTFQYVEASSGFSTIRVDNASSSAPSAFVVGDIVGIGDSSLSDPDELFRARITSIGDIGVYSSNGFTYFYRYVTLDRVTPRAYGGAFSRPNTSTGYIGRVLSIDEPRVFAALKVPAGASNTALAAAVSSARVQVVPYIGSGAYPTADLGINPAPFAYSSGAITAVKVGDEATLWHEATTVAATQTNGSTVNVGRTSLSQAAVVDANGVEVVRFLTTGPTTPAAITADLSTGVITFVSVTGLSQPLSVRHRIAHRCTVSSAVVATGVVNFTPALTRDFPADSILSTHAPVGDMQARAFNQYSQQAWTSVWSDTLIGNASTLQYTGTITVTNAGAETDRYRLQFSSATEFTAYSERLGLLGSGTTAAAFSPLNPATGAPLFTLASSGFTTGILVGSNFRFNTEGASAPVWVVQSIAPSTAAGTTNTALRIHGSV